jgi:hypothetical protein
MTEVLDAVEYAAWQLAAEPVEWRMDNLLAIVRERAAEIAGARGALRASERPEIVSLIPNMPYVASAPEDRSGSPRRADDDDAPDDDSVDFDDDAPGDDELPEEPACRLAEEPARREQAPGPFPEVTPLIQALWKACTSCGARKPPDGYSRDSSRKSGRRSQCKACASERARTTSQAKKRQEAGA